MDELPESRGLMGNPKSKSRSNYNRFWALGLDDDILPDEALARLSDEDLLSDDEVSARLSGVWISRSSSDDVSASGFRVSQLSPIISDDDVTARSYKSVLLGFRPTMDESLGKSLGGSSSGSLIESSSSGWISLTSLDETKVIKIPSNIIPVPPSTSDQRHQRLLLAEEESMMMTMQERSKLDDEELLDLIRPCKQFAQKDPKRIVNLLRRYFSSVTANKGFICLHFPGYVLGLTPIEPKYKIIYSGYDESASHVHHMAKFALDSYNRVTGTRFTVQKLKDVNRWSAKKIYYIEFVGWEVRKKEENELDDDTGPILAFQTTFRAKVQDRTRTFFKEPMAGDVEVDDLLPGMFLVLGVNALSSDYKEDSDVEDSDEEDPDETDEEDDEISDDEVDHVDLVREDGSSITDADLLKWMVGDGRSIEEKEKLLPKVRRYLKSVWETEGFECDSFPGHIWTVTTWQPSQEVVEKRHRYPEGYDYMIFLASLAIISFNKTNGTEFIVKSIDKVNVNQSMYYKYAITFTAQQPGAQDEVIFQSHMLEIKIELRYEVISCRLKPTL